MQGPPVAPPPGGMGDGAPPGGMGAPPPGGMGGAPPPGGPVGYYTPPSGSASRPGVVLWYRVFAACSLLVYLTFGLAFSTIGAASGAETGIILAIMLPFVVLNGVGAFVPFKPWGWTVGLIVIALGMFSCLAPLSVILVIFWNRPATKAAFQRV